MAYRLSPFSVQLPLSTWPKVSDDAKCPRLKVHVPVEVNNIVFLTSEGMGNNLQGEDVLDEINRFVRSSGLSSSTSSSGPLSFAASSSTLSSSPSYAPPLRHPHSTGGAGRTQSWPNPTAPESPCIPRQARQRTASDDRRYKREELLLLEGRLLQLRLLQHPYQTSGYNIDQRSHTVQIPTRHLHRKSDLLELCQQ